MAKSYEELKQENFEACEILLDYQEWRDDGVELDKRVAELIAKMMPLTDLKPSREIEPPHP